MDKRIKDFLESGQLESYILGNLPPEENALVEKMIESHPEIRSEYLKVQDELEMLAMKNAIQPPAELKSKVLQQAQHSSIKQASKSIPWTWIIGSILLGIGLLYSLFSLQSANKENEVLKLNYANLEKECQEREQMVASLMDIDVEKGKIVGNELLPSFEIAFLYDKQNQIAYYSTTSINLPKNKCLQLWGDKDGKMIPLGVLTKTMEGTFTSIEFDPKMVSFNVTIEDRIENGFQDHPDVSKLIGSLAI